MTVATWDLFFLSCYI